jgi:hypothetical protein
VVRLDRWRGRSRFGLRAWDPRARFKRRAWARTRDLLHLQRPELVNPQAGRVVDRARVAKNEAVRLLAGERRMPELPGGDSWPLGLIDGTPIRSASEAHALVVALQEVARAGQHGGR